MRPYRMGVMDRRGLGVENTAPEYQNGATQKEEITVSNITAEETGAKEKTTEGKILSFLSGKSGEIFRESIDSHWRCKYHHISEEPAAIQQLYREVLAAIYADNPPGDNQSKHKWHRSHNFDRRRNIPDGIFSDYAVLVLDMEDVVKDCSGETGDTSPKAHVKFHSELWQGPAVISWLSNVTAEKTLRAARMDFDGIIADTDTPEHINSIITRVVERKKRGYAIYRRYLKLRRLYRKNHNNRQKLEQKVDLICRDIVQSNVHLGTTLENIRKAYEFQNSLTGEFDLRYMLHKALRQIKENITDSNAAIYLTEEDDFEAHIFGPWYDNQQDMEQIESSLRQTAVAWVLENQRVLLVPEAANLPYGNASQRNELTGLSLLAVPVMYQDQLNAVLIIYRSSELPLEQADKQSVMLFTGPLGNAITALNKLQSLIVT